MKKWFARMSAVWATALLFSLPITFFGQNKNTEDIFPKDITEFMRVDIDILCDIYPCRPIAKKYCQYFLTISDINNVQNNIRALNNILMAIGNDIVVSNYIGTYESDRCSGASAKIIISKKDTSEFLKNLEKIKKRVTAKYPFKILQIDSKELGEDFWVTVIAKKSMKKICNFIKMLPDDILPENFFGSSDSFVFMIPLPDDGNIKKTIQKTVNSMRRIYIKTASIQNYATLVTNN